MSESKTLDCRGLDCPQPVINTKNALDGLSTTLVVVVDNDGACTNVTRFAQSQGAKVSVEKVGKEFTLTIEPGKGGPAVPEPPIVCEISSSGKKGTRDMVVYISSEGMGSGDHELGKTLMAAFVDTLSQFGKEISHVIFVNTAAKLAVHGSPVVEQIKNLEDLGVDILTCGTCLNHFGIKEKLEVGSVSNMFSIIETLSEAGRIIRP